MSKLTGSIVVYKSDIGQLKRAVESFLVAAPGCQLYVIDNSPTREGESVCQHPDVHYSFVGWNMGFGSAHNLALKKVMASASTYHVVLNPDVYFDDGALNRLTKFMDENSNVGLAMPKVLYPDGRLQPVCRLLPSPYTLIMRRLLSPFKRIAQKVNHNYEMRFTGYDRVMDVPFLSGCFMFLRIDSLRSTGLFDENIFLYTEDIDLTRRLHQQYRTVFYPDVTIYHHHMSSSRKSFKAWMQHAASAITYFNKWGWFNDHERDLINKRTILKLQ